MKKLLFLLMLMLFTVRPSIVFAESSYVMPYPGIMPGNKLYILSDFLDTAKSFYTFGDIAKFKYNLSQSDKYLIEAKILFEYNQYPLAVHSLNKSNEYYLSANKNLTKAQDRGKNISIIQSMYKNAGVKHAEILDELRMSLPVTFLWQDEKKSPVLLQIKDLIDSSIDYRSIH